jgi:hypothetical protein
MIESGDRLGQGRGSSQQKNAPGGARGDHDMTRGRGAARG